jgi:DNA-binding NtrC family response regulator
MEYTKGNANVLIVDDEPNALKVLTAILSENGYRIFTAKSAEEGLAVLKKANIDAVITDYRMPGRDGMQFFEYTVETYPDIPVIFLTAFGTVESAVTAITKGVFYYFVKPPDYVQLKSILAKAVEQRLLKKEIDALRKKLYTNKNGCVIIGDTPYMRKIYDTIESVKDSASNVLIFGETGTGKELVARALHYHSSRKDRPFIAVNCAAIPRELIESELFGYEKGAFTGAVSRRIGRCEETADGSLFLDEIGELDPVVQSKLLRVIQEREVERLGNNRKVPVYFRLISSTNRDLQKEVQKGTFREDLFYRINVVPIYLPPLRERRDDIPLLVAEFLRELCARENKVLTVTDEVMNVFKNYPWFGNVRQLRNVIERAVVLAKKDAITVKEIPDELKTLKTAQSSNGMKSLKEIEVTAVHNAIKECGGNKSKAAQLLGISRKALYKRLNDLSIS